MTSGGENARGDVHLDPISVDSSQCPPCRDSKWKFSLKTEELGAVVKRLISSIPGMKAELKDLKIDLTTAFTQCCEGGYSVDATGTIKVGVSGTFPIESVTIEGTVTAPGSPYEFVYKLKAAAIEFVYSADLVATLKFAVDCKGVKSVCYTASLGATVGLQSEFTISGAVQEASTHKVVREVTGSVRLGVYGSVDLKYEDCTGSDPKFSFCATVKVEGATQLKLTDFGLSETLSVSESREFCFFQKGGMESSSAESDKIGQSQDVAMVVDISRYESEWNGFTIPAFSNDTDSVLASFSETDFAIGLGYANAAEMEDKLGLESAATGLFDDWLRKALRRQAIKEGAARGAGICAQVALQIDQQVLLQQQSFNARLNIRNSGATAISGILARVFIRDRNGNDVTDQFVIRVSGLRDLESVSGGSLGPQSDADVEWNIVPREFSVGADGEEYLVCGDLSYSDGDMLTIPLAGVVIRVVPSPSLAVHYFHQRDVLSDDPFTDVVEPSQPYDLGVMIVNTGYGVARNVSITSAQPKIVENEKGLLANFQIIGTEVAGQNLTPSLTANFGEIDPGQIVQGRWLLTSTIQGQFIDYSATFQHEDELGNTGPSLIKSVDIHELIHL
ncbi:MAG: hypothetical protein JSS02_00520, partial [Planctomycetes bacterium]|nr:hypothetical protein [Planctomycetota bacterium]